MNARGRLEPYNRVIGTAGSHQITSTYTPVSERLVCSCGWRHTETRRQNALARAARVRAVVRKHLETVGIHHDD